MKQIVIIADDLTGACDTGIKFRRLGLKTKVLVDPRSCPPLDADPVPVISISTGTRSAAPAEAKDAVADLLRQLRGRGDFLYYKKVDSVLRGNIVSELEALFQELRPDFALIAPAFPATGRWLRDGLLRIGNKVHPKLEIDALALLSSGTERKCGHIDLETVRRGPKAVIERTEALCREGATLILADTWCESDLKILSQVVSHFGSRCLPVGSAGLANHLAQQFCVSSPADAGTAPAQSPPDGALVVVVGSRHPVTVEQVQRLKEAVPLETYLLPVGGIDQSNLQERVKQVFAQRAPAEGSRQILLTTDFIYNSSDNCRHLLQQNAYNQAILDGISLCAEALAKAVPIRGMIATGGDIASEILGRLKLNQIDLMDEPIPGIVTGRAADSRGNGFLLATKSGGFGAPDALLELYEYMRLS